MLSMKKIRIFIADDHPVLRSGIKSLISERPEYEVVGEADSGVEALNMISVLKPDIVMMDITMPGVNGIEATKRILEERPDVKVVMLSMHTDVFHAIDAFRAGAIAYVLKDSGATELFQAIEKALVGEKFASPAVTAGLLNDFVDNIRQTQSHEPFDTLSAREREVLKLIADGLTSKEVAEKLFISVATVKSHRNNLMRKLNCNEMAGLIKIAIRKGLVTQE